MLILALEASLEAQSRGGVLYLVIHKNIGDLSTEGYNERMSGLAMPELESDSIYLLARNILEFVDKHDEIFTEKSSEYIRVVTHLSLGGVKIFKFNPLQKIEKEMIESSKRSGVIGEEEYNRLLRDED